jgi:hypothetical protein
MSRHIKIIVGLFLRVQFSYSDLDRRVTTVENGFMALGTRVDRMEDRLG